MLRLDQNMSCRDTEASGPLPAAYKNIKGRGQGTGDGRAAIDPGKGAITTPKQCPGSFEHPCLSDARP